MNRHCKRCGGGGMMWDARDDCQFCVYCGHRVYHPRTLAPHIPAGKLAGHKFSRKGVGGRKPSYTPEQRNEVRALRDAGYTIRAIADKLGLSWSAVQRIA